MAIFSVFTGKSRSLFDVLGYVANDRQTAISGGYGISPNIYDAYRQMLLVKNIYRKEGGRQYIHSVLSFAPEESQYISSNLLQYVAFQAATFFPYGYQVFYGCHFSKQHVHIHFVVNSVNSIDGSKLDIKKRDLLNLKKSLSNLLVCLGLDAVRFNDWEK